MFNELVEKLLREELLDEVVNEGKDPDHRKDKEKEILRKLVEQDDDVFDDEEDTLSDESPAEEDLLDEEPEEVTEKPKEELELPDKLYIGKKEDNHYYLQPVTSNEAEAGEEVEEVEESKQKKTLRERLEDNELPEGEYNIVDQEDEVVVPSEEGEKVSDLLVRGVRELQIDFITRDAFEKLIVPVLEEEPREEEEEVEEKEPDLSDEIVEEPEAEVEESKQKKQDKEKKDKEKKITDSRLQNRRFGLREAVKRFREVERKKPAIKVIKESKTSVLIEVDNEKHLLDSKVINLYREKGKLTEAALQQLAVDIKAVNSSKREEKLQQHKSPHSK